MKTNKIYENKTDEIEWRIIDDFLPIFFPSLKKSFLSVDLNLIILRKIENCKL